MDLLLSVPHFLWCRIETLNVESTCAEAVQLKMQPETSCQFEGGVALALSFSAPHAVLGVRSYLPIFHGHFSLQSSHCIRGCVFKRPIPSSSRSEVRIYLYLPRDATIAPRIHQYQQSVRFTRKYDLNESRRLRSCTSTVKCQNSERSTMSSTNRHSGSSRNQNGSC
jgi:hypothetical protein